MDEKRLIEEAKKGNKEALHTLIENNVNYHPPLEVEASCFIDQTCYWDYIPSSRGPISTGVNSGSPYPTDYQTLDHHDLVIFYDGL